MSELSDPAVGAFAVTPSDTTVLAGVRSLYVGTAGDVAVMPKGSSTAVTLLNASSGSVIPIRVSQVMATNTTATDIVALT